MGDIDVREKMLDAIYKGFIKPRSDYTLPTKFGMFTLTLHKTRRFLPSASAILRVWTNFPRAWWADVNRRWLFACGVG